MTQRGPSPPLPRARRCGPRRRARWLWRTWATRATLLQCVLVFTFAARTALAQPEGAPRHVVVVFLDGPRYTETLGQPERIPFLAGVVGHSGVIFSEFYNLGTTKTVSGHSTVLTATWQHLRNDGTERPHAPTLFELLRAQQGLPAQALWVVSGKQKLEVLGHSDAPGFGAGFAGRDSVGLGADAHTMGVVEGVLGAYHPRLTLVNLADIDLAGHAGNWEQYLHRISVADSLLSELWQTIQRDSELSGSTTLLITYDHGRHDDRPTEPHQGFASHGDGCQGCRHIAAYAIGCDIRAGVHSAEPHDLCDLGTTLAWLLGVAPPRVEGQILSGMLTFPQRPAPGVESSKVAQPCTLSAAWILDGIAVNLHTLATQPAVDLGVFDASGRRLALLERGPISAGDHRYEWKTSGDEPAPPAGDLVVRFVAPGEVSIADLHARASR